MYFAFIIVFLLVGAVLPSLRLLSLDDDPSMWEAMVLPYTLREGLAYTIAASLLFVGVALLCRPGKPARSHPAQQLSSRLVTLCWGLGIGGQMITLLLNALFGMSSSNLTAQRPLFAVLLGYFSMIGIVGGTAFFFHELRFSGFSRRLMLYLLVQCAALATSWSRSAVVFVGLSVVLGLAYSQRQRRIRLPSVKIMWITAVLVTAAVGSAIYGQKQRQGETSLGPFAREGMRRLFANQLTLFIAIDRFDDVNHILLEDQPAVLLDQMFSFVRTRTKYPSSFRYVELGGGAVGPDERNHIAGYAFGWLGLTYGLAGFWGGLLLVAVLLWLHLGLMLSCYRRTRSLLAMLFFGVFAGSLLEFLFNLGLDSFGEKLFKNSLYALITYWMVMGLAYATRRTAPLVRVLPPPLSDAQSHTP